jgi:hypothetical protein
MDLYPMRTLVRYELNRILDRVSGKLLEKPYSGFCRAKIKINYNNKTYIFIASKIRKRAILT